MFIRSCSDISGKLWIGTNGSGLDLYDPKTEILHHYDYMNSTHQ